MGSFDPPRDSDPRPGGWLLLSWLVRERLVGFTGRCSGRSLRRRGVLGGDAGDHDVDESLGSGFAGRWFGVVHLPDAGESEQEVVAGEVGPNSACLLVGREQ